MDTVTDIGLGMVGFIIGSMALSSLAQWLFEIRKTMRDQSATLRGGLAASVLAGGVPWGFAATAISVWFLHSEPWITPIFIGALVGIAFVSLLAVQMTRKARTAARLQAPTSTATFDMAFSREIAAEAAAQFRDYRFKRYGLLMITACAINVLGFCVALWSGFYPPANYLFLVIGSPLWLLYEHFIWPRAYALRLVRSLSSATQVSINREWIFVAARGQYTPIRWSRIKKVVQTPSVFLLVLSPFAFLFIPTAGLPVDARDVLCSKALADAGRSVSPYAL
jgi:hypothetical protein